jgi:hypothetical protein
MREGKAMHEQLSHAQRPVCLARAIGQTPEEACQLPNPCPVHCGAKCRRSDEYGSRFCANKAKRPNGRCRMHGGNHRAGPDHGRFTHGRNWLERVLPKDMRKAYARLVDDPEVQALTEEIRLLSVKERLVIDKLNETSAPPWGDAVEALNDFVIAYRSDKKKLVDKREERLQKLVEIIRTGADAATHCQQLWSEFRALAQEKGTLVRNERDWQAKLRTMYTAEQGLAMIHAVKLPAVETLNDTPDLLTKFVERLCSLLPDAELKQVSVLENPTNDSES